jgi:ribonuclease HII
LAGDPRPGARKLIEKHERKAIREEKAASKTQGLLVHEREIWGKGVAHVAGLDEAGRGPLAGPVVAAAVILRPDRVPRGLDDSKKLSPERRDSLEPIIRESALAVGVGQASAGEIDELNIYRAAQVAMERAVEALGVRPGFLLTDAMPLPRLSDLPQRPLVHGDALSASIAAVNSWRPRTPRPFIRWGSGSSERRSRS